MQEAMRYGNGTSCTCNVAFRFFFTGIRKHCYPRDLIGWGKWRHMPSGRGEIWMSLKDIFKFRHLNFFIKRLHIDSFCFMIVLPACVYMFNLCVQWCQKSVEGIRLSGTEVTHGLWYTLMVQRTTLRSSARAASALITEKCIQPLTLKLHNVCFVVALNSYAAMNFV